MSLNRSKRLILWGLWDMGEVGLRNGTQPTRLKRRKSDVSNRSSVWIWYNFTKSNIWQNQGL